MDKKQIKKRQIVLSVIPIGIFAVILLPVLYFVNELTPKTAEPIVLPDIETVQTVEITTMDGLTVSCGDRERIGQLLSVFAQAAATSKGSLQDTPSVARCGKVDISSNGGLTTLYYYIEDGKSFIEQPYQGIYETNVDLDAFVLSIE